MFHDNWLLCLKNIHFLFQSEELLIANLHTSMLSLIKRIMLIYWDPTHVTGTDDLTSLEHTDRTRQLSDLNLSVGDGCRQRMIVLEDDGSLDRTEVTTFYR